MFNIEVDFGSDLGSLCSFYPLDRDQSGERNKEQRISKTTEHVFCRSKLQRGVFGLRLGGVEVEGCVVAGFRITMVIVERGKLPRLLIPTSPPPKLTKTQSIFKLSPARGLETNEHPPTMV